jgi:hypothetical protein
MPVGRYIEYMNLENELTFSVSEDGVYCYEFEEMVDFVTGFIARIYIDTSNKQYKFILRDAGKKFEILIPSHSNYMECIKYDNLNSINKDFSITFTKNYIEQCGVLSVPITENPKAIFDNPRPTDAEFHTRISFYNNKLDALLF